MPALHRDVSTLPVGTGDMTLIAEQEGLEVAKIHGPHRTEFILEYRNPETGHATRISRSKLHVLRVLAERAFPGLVWKDAAAVAYGVVEAAGAACRSSC